MYKKLVQHKPFKKADVENKVLGRVHSVLFHVTLCKYYVLFLLRL